MKLRKYLKYFLAVLALYYIFTCFFVGKRDPKQSLIILPSLPSNYNSFYLHPAWLLNDSNSKLLTLATSFIATSDRLSDQEKLYRHNAQLNFLLTTQFPSLLPFINFVIFTDDSEWVRLIRAEYQSVTPCPLPPTPTPSPPLLRDLFLGAMRLHSTPFYMFSNADDLFDSSLLQTLRAVLGEVGQGRLRTKLLLVGHRWDLAYRGRLGGERDVQKLLRYASKHMPVAKDYFVVTRDSVEWDSFPDFFIGRRWFDSFVVQQAFFSETELIDGSATVRLVHQVRRTGYWSSMHANATQNAWNQRLLGTDSHSSIHCSRYLSRPPYAAVRIYDKKRSQSLHSLPPALLLPRHNQLVHDILARREVLDSADVTISVLAYNRPAALSRLLGSLSAASYAGAGRVHLRVQVDRGRTGAYDVEVLELLRGYSWQGGYSVLLQPAHLGQLEQWVRAWNDSTSGTSLILEDDVILSPHFFRVLSSALSAYADTSGLAGFSLELPFLLTHDQHLHSSSLLVSCYRRSRAFLPHPLHRSAFVRWYDSLPPSPLLSTFHSLYRHYAVAEGLGVGYLVDAGGHLATRAYSTTAGDSDFLSDTCYRSDRAFLQLDGPLLYTQPLISLPASPPYCTALC